MITQTFFGEAIGDRPQIQDPIPYVACTCHGFRRVESLGVFFPAGMRYVAMRNPRCPIHGACSCGQREVFFASTATWGRVNIYDPSCPRHGVGR